MTREREEFRADLGSVTAGRLVFTRGMSELDLHAADSSEDLYRARFEGVVPEVRVDGGEITVEYPNVLNPFKSSRISADIRLNTEIPWEIEVRGGAASVRADLTRLEVGRFSLTGGVSDVAVDLPAASGRVPVEFVGGASELRVSRPKDTAASLVVTGGATNLTFDDQEFGAVGGKVSLSSTGYDDSEGRYDVSLTGGVSNLALTRKG